MWAPAKCQVDLVSVIIPTFNRADVITDAMQSVYQQTYRPIELVIVDDGSTDSTNKVVATFSEKYCDDKLFTVNYIAKTNEGSQVARNVGVRVSSGEFIQFLDSDDILCDHKLANAVRFYRGDPAIDLVYSRWLVDNGKRLIEMNGPSPSSASLLCEAVLCNLCIFSPVYRRNCLLDVGPFNEELMKAQDIEYCMRVVSRTNKAVRDDMIGGVYRLGKTENSIIGSVNPGKLRSEWKVNRWQKHLLGSEPRGLARDRAFALLNRRANSIATRSIAGGCPELGLRIMISEYKLWWPLTPKRTVKCLILSSRLLIEFIKQFFLRLR